MCLYIYTFELASKKIMGSRQSGWYPFIANSTPDTFSVAEFIVSPPARMTQYYLLDANIKDKSQRKVHIRDETGNRTYRRAVCIVYMIICAMFTYRS